MLLLSIPLLKKAGEELELVHAKADEAKVKAEIARDNMRKSREEVEQARAAASIAESRLQAAMKEMEAARASEEILHAIISKTPKSKWQGNA